MSYRKSFKLICGVAGGSAALVLAAAAAADCRGYFGEQRGSACGWSRFSVQAAQPAPHTAAPTGHSWDFNWDKCVSHGFSPISISIHDVTTVSIYPLRVQLSTTLKKDVT